MNNNVNNQQPMQTQQPLKQCKYCKRGIDRAAKVCPYCNREQSSAAKIVFAILFAFIVFSVLCVYVFPPLWNEFFPKEKETVNTPTPRNYTYQTSPPTTQPATAEPIIMYDENNIKIYYVGLSESGLSKKLDVYIENNTDKNLMIQVDDFTVNDFVVSTAFSSDVPAGKKIYDDISMLKSSLEKSNIDKIEKIEFTFDIVNADDWSDNYNTQPIKLTW